MVAGARHGGKDFGFRKAVGSGGFDGGDCRFAVKSTVDEDDGRFSEFFGNAGESWAELLFVVGGVGQGLADEFEKGVVAAGGKVATREFTNDKATDFAAILTKIKSKKVDVIFYGGMDAQGGPMVKQMKSLGLKAKYLSGDGSCTPEFIKLAGEASEGQYCSLPGVPLEQMPGGKTFGDAFSAKYGQIQLYAPYVYDATMVMVDAMKRANSVESAKFLPEIGKTDYQGVTAKIQFDEKGDLKGGAISLYQVKAGKWEYRETVGGAPAAPKAEGEKK